MKESLRERFDKKGFSPTSYARAHKVDRSLLTKVLEGKLNGSKGHRGGATRKIILQLKKDGVFIGKTTWER